jgi:type IV pilus assembly protein PilA
MSTRAQYDTCVVKVSAGAADERWVQASCGPSRAVESVPASVPLGESSVNENNDGFTLIELLVVVIIIGVLAAIAIPSMIRHRDRGWQAELASAVTILAIEVEAVATASDGNYPLVAPTVAGITDDADLALDYVRVDPLSFVICAQHSAITVEHNVSYDSAAGGFQGFASGTGAACP